MMVLVVVVFVVSVAGVVVVSLLFAAMPHVLLHDLLLFAAASFAHVTGRPMHLAVGAANTTTKVGDAVELTGARDHTPASLADAAVSETKIQISKSTTVKNAKKKDTE